MVDMNRGYAGYSMSRRARAAYEVGCKPITKWGRADLDAFHALEEEMGVDFKVTTVAEFRELLRWAGIASWHHTSIRANRTDFYHPLVLAGLDEDRIANLDGAGLDPDAVEEFRLSAKRWALRQEFRARMAACQQEG